MAVVRQGGQVGEDRKTPAVVLLGWKDAGDPGYKG